MSMTVESLKNSNSIPLAFQTEELIECVDDKPPCVHMKQMTGHHGLEIVLSRLVLRIF